MRNAGATRYAPENPEIRRPGITAIAEELREQDPRLSEETAIALAKAEWHKRNPTLRAVDPQPYERDEEGYLAHVMSGGAR